MVKRFMRGELNSTDKKRYTSKTIVKKKDRSIRIKHLSDKRDLLNKKFNLVIEKEFTIKENHLERMSDFEQKICLK